MNGILNFVKIKIDTITNDLELVDREKNISENKIEYYRIKKNEFYVRYKETIDSVNTIQNEQLFMLYEIKKIFEKHKTKFKVIISPLYEQKKMNSIDFNILKNIFRQNLYDFSGKNKFNDDKFNFYETSHFRTNVGDSILNYIYKESLVSDKNRN